MSAWGTDTWVRCRGGQAMEKEPPGEEPVQETDLKLHTGSMPLIKKQTLSRCFHSLLSTNYLYVI